MKIYHLFPDEKYVDDFISKVLACSEAPQRNVFMVRAEKPFSRVRRHTDKVIEAPLLSDVLTEKVEGVQKEDLFLVHYFERRVCEWLNTIDRSLTLGWVFWGAEFYNNAGIEYPLYGPLTKKIYRPYLLDQAWLYRIPFFREIEIFYEENIKAPRMRRLKGKAFSRVRYFYNYNKYNYELLRKNFDTPAEFVYFIYPRIFDVPDFAEAAELPFRIDPGQRNLVIGNSANYSNNHLEVMDKITPDESLTLWVPLSYGNKDYARYLSEVGKKKFGANFRVLSDYLPSGQYFEFLKKMDAGLFGNYRPMAMGNITTLLAQGKDLFMDDQNPATKYLRDQGFTVHSVEDISTAFLMRSIDNEAAERNKKLAQRFFYGDEIDKLYRKLF